MSRKRKKKQEEESAMEEIVDSNKEQTPPPPVPEPELIPQPIQEVNFEEKPVEPSLAKEPEPAPQPVQEPQIEEKPIEPPPVTEPELVASTPAVQPADDELPPPPADLKASGRQFPAIKTRKPGVGAGLKRAGAIFGKDARTIAKHGLVSSVILLVFLMLIYYIASYTMFTFVTNGFGEDKGDGNGNNTGGDSGPNLGNDGSLVAHAGSGQTVTAGTLVTLDSSATEHNADIVYVMWEIEKQSQSGGDERYSLFGGTVESRFYEVGQFTVNLIVVDARWNMAQANFTVVVNPNTSDHTAPNPSINSTIGPGGVTYGTPVFFDASNSTDDVGIVNWTWKIHDVIDVTIYDEKRLNYTFMSTGDKQVTLVVRDAAGNANSTSGSVNVMSSDMSDNSWPSARIGDLPKTVNVGDTVRLDASQSSDDRGIVNYTWYIQINNTKLQPLKGQTPSFIASGFGQYQITLVVKDQAGNANRADTGLMSLSEGMKEPSMVSWTSTPLGQDIPFNVLTFTYGAALLACVIFLGGLFAKGFTHEISKGTAKTLFFAPVSVTNMVFAKLLYPLIIGPLFIFPLLIVSLTPLQQDPMQILEISLVSYVMTALVLISGAYGSCLIYAATKRMSIKPSVTARSFMYLSLVGTLAIFTGLAYLLDNWFATDMWTSTKEQLGPQIAMFSPFHQGGLAIQSLLFGAPLGLDWMVFVIPLVLIVGGILASRKLYGDIFARE